MHFSKEYSQLLLTLPPTLAEKAIQYRELKKLINQLVLELAIFGLNPAITEELLRVPDASNIINNSSVDNSRSSTESAIKPLKVNYEVKSDGTFVQPLLRLSVKLSDTPPECESSFGEASSQATPQEVQRSTIGDVSTQPSIDLSSKLRALQIQDDILHAEKLTDGSREVVIPLVSDAAFYQLLSSGLRTLSMHLQATQSDFITALRALSRDISHSARPVSSVSHFRHYTPSSNPTSVRVSSFPKWSKSDLYLWREIFQIYIDASPFEGIHEEDRGDRTLKQSEERLNLFMREVSGRNLEQKLTLQQSRDGLKTFLQLNVFILNLKKFQFANAEAARKILKKHQKRTSLAIPFPAMLMAGDSPPSKTFPPEISLVPTSLPRNLVQAIGEIVLPIIPHIDDYVCLICTSIAFKPIRLSCRHLFCVRCLIIMQRAGKGNCPLCRAPTVLSADRSNVDWALINFMRDWFPDEAKAKLLQNERDAAEDEIRALGMDPGSCIIM